MENSEAIFVRGLFGKKQTHDAKIIRIIYFILVGVLLVVGLICGSEKFSYHADIVVGMSFGREGFTISWFNLFFLFSHEKYSKYDWVKDKIENKIGWGGIILFLLMFVFLFLVPIIIDAIDKRVCKNTSLTVSSSRVYGTYNSFLSQKVFALPIEKVDSLTVENTWMDKLRSASTLGIRSTSGVIKLSFVQNAEEVVSVAMKRISELKTKEEKAHETMFYDNVSVSTTDKLKELLAMKDSGLITEEEFAKLKQDILSKM